MKILVFDDRRTIRNFIQDEFESYENILHFCKDIYEADEFLDYIEEKTIVNDDGSWSIDFVDISKFEKGDVIKITQIEDGKEPSDEIVIVIGQEISIDNLSSESTINPINEDETIIGGTGKPGVEIIVRMPRKKNIDGIILDVMIPTAGLSDEHRKLTKGGILTGWVWLWHHRNKEKLSQHPFENIPIIIYTAYKVDYDMYIASDQPTKAEKEFSNKITVISKDEDEDEVIELIREFFGLNNI